MEQATALDFKHTQLLAPHTVYGQQEITLEQ